MTARLGCPHAHTRAPASTTPPHARHVHPPLSLQSSSSSPAPSSFVSPFSGNGPVAVDATLGGIYYASQGANVFTVYRGALAAGLASSYATIAGSLTGYCTALAVQPGSASTPGKATLYVAFVSGGTPSIASVSAADTCSGCGLTATLPTGSLGAAISSMTYSVTEVRARPRCRACRGRLAQMNQSLTAAACAASISV